MSTIGASSEQDDLNTQFREAELQEGRPIAIAPTTEVAMAEEPVPATRQRKKRKWDQPAEPVAPPTMTAPAMPGLMPFGGAHPLSGLGLPNMFASMMGNYMGLPMNSLPFSAASAMGASNAAAAIVQKINQDLVTKGLIPPAKINDEVIAREITINDADPGVRYKLTKRQTQEEIQAKTGAVVITRGRYRAPNGPPDLEKPLYLHISAGVQLKDTAERIKSVDAAAAMVEEMMKQGPSPVGTTQIGLGGPSFSVVVNVGIEVDPSFNLLGRIRGPNDQYINHIMTETGAEVFIRGRGSGSRDPSSGEELQQPLHLVISSDNPKSLDDARRLSENLLETIRADSFSFRPAPYQPSPNVPPPNYNHVQASPHMSSSMRPSHPYQHPSNLGPVPPGVQNPGFNFRPSGFPSRFPSGPHSWHAGVAASVPGLVPQPAPPGKNLMDPYANMGPPPKPYGAVPPPQQLLLGGSLETGTSSTSEPTRGLGADTDTEEEREPPTTSAVSFPAPSFVMAASSPAPIVGFIRQGAPQLGTDANYKPPSAPPYYEAPGGIPYPNQSYSGPAPAQSYGGYGGVYPQLSPLQQVVSALHRPPPPVSVKPGSGIAGGSPSGTEQQGSVQKSGENNRHTEKPVSGPVQKERRKFQEFPAAVKPVPSEEFQLQQRHGTALQGLDEPSVRSDADETKMPPPPPKLVPLKSMPPPAPKSMPPPPSVLQQAQKDELKLVEYGEEDDEDYLAKTELDRRKTDSEAHPNPLPPNSNGKPFWAP